MHELELFIQFLKWYCTRFYVFPVNLTLWYFYSKNLNIAHYPTLIYYSNTLRVITFIIKINVKFREFIIALVVWRPYNTIQMPREKYNFRKLFDK